MSHTTLSLASNSVLRISPAAHSATEDVKPNLVTYQPKYAPQPVANVPVGHSRSSSIGSSFSAISAREAAKDQQAHRGRFKDEDDKLFDFLNAKERVHVQRAKSSHRSLSPKKEEEAMSIASNEPSIDVISMSSEEERNKSSGKSSPAEDAPPPELSPDEQIKKYQETIKSMSQEIAALTKRNVETETDLKRLNRRLENWQSQLSSSDTALRELQSKEVDLKAAIEAKDAQIGVLKIRLHEADEKLRVKTETIDSLRLEYDALVKEREENHINFDENLESLRKRIQELEAELFNEKDRLRQAQTEAMIQQGRLEDNQKQLVDELSRVQSDLKRERNTRKELEKQVRQAATTYEALETEYQEYKAKAQKTLQSKDDLIKALNRTRNDGDEGIADTSDAQIAFEESNSANLVLQAQCDALVVEVQELRDKNDELKKEIQRLRNDELDNLSARVYALNEELEENNRLRGELDNELRQAQDELKYYKDELVQVRDSLTARIGDRDEEIGKLRKQLVSKLSSSSGQSVQELEARVKSLTDNLIQKQTQIEQLTSERHSLALQLERSDARLRQALDSAKPGPDSVAIGMVHSASASNLVNRGGYRPYADYENPQDSHVTRRVKRAYGQLDAFRCVVN